MLERFMQVLYNQIKTSEVKFKNRAHQQPHNWRKRMELINYILIIYCIILNIIGYAMMGIDKSKAKNNKWRIKEKTLFLVAVLGGSVGSILGMRHFHHKTQKRDFVFGMPLILIVQIIAILIIFNQITA